MACTSSAPSDPQPSGSSSTAAPIPVPGGTLRVSLGSLDSLDPSGAIHPAELLLARARFRGLTTIDSSAPGQITEGLAQSWRFESGATRVRFTLKAGLRDSGGSPITSQTARAWFDHLAKASTASPHAFILASVVGFREVNMGAEKRLRGVTTPDAKTIVFQLSRPFGAFPVLLAHPAAGIVPGTGSDFGPTRPSSGPFVLTDAEVGRRALLRRNENVTGPSAYLEGLEIRVVDDPARAMRAGTIDIGVVRGDVPTEAATAEIWATVSIGVHVGKLPNLEARRALRAAIDTDALALVGRGAIAARGLVPPDLLDAGEDNPFNVVSARQRWKSSRHPAKPLRFVHLDDPQSTALAEAVREQFAAAGITVENRSVDPGRYPQILADRDFDLVQLAWLVEMPSPDGFLAGQLSSTSVDNKTGWRDTTFDGLISRAHRATSASVRRDVYEQAQSRALGQVPQIPLLHLRTRYLSDPRIQGLSLDGSGSFDPAVVWFLATG